MSKFILGFVPSLALAVFIATPSDGLASEPTYSEAKIVCSAHVQQIPDGRKDSGDLIDTTIELTDKQFWGEQTSIAATVGEVNFAVRPVSLQAKFVQIEPKLVSKIAAVDLAIEIQPINTVKVVSWLTDDFNSKYTTVGHLINKDSASGLKFDVRPNVTTSTGTRILSASMNCRFQ